MEMNRTHSCNVELAFLCCSDIQKSGTAAVLVAHIHDTEVTKCLDGNYDFYCYCARLPAFLNVLGGASMLLHQDRPFAIKQRP